MSSPDHVPAPKAGIGLVYLAIVLSTLVISLDFASIDLALPAIEKQFGLNFDAVQWVINGYVLAFSVLMVAGGKFADAYGRRRIFLGGMAVFTLASFLGGFAWNGPSVIAFRVLQGLGAAFLWPAMIGMACAAVGDARRAVALGIIFGTSSLGNAAGPIVGGAFTEWFSWRWVLWLNVPLAILAMFATIRAVPSDKTSGEKPKNDFAGMIALTGGLVALMLFVYQGDSWGWVDVRTLTLAGVAVLLLGAFPFLEQRSPAPLIDLAIMRNREVATLCFCVMAICQLFFIILLYFTQYGLKFLGDDPIAAGARVVQFMLFFGVVSYFGGPLMKLLGARMLLIIGFVLSIIATVTLALCGPGASWLPFNVGLILLGAGVGAIIPTVSARSIETVGTARASLVSGITIMCQLAGSALMLAVNSALFNATAASTFARLVQQGGLTLTPKQEEAAHAILTGAKSIHAPPLHKVSDVTEIANLLTTAYASGLQVVLWFGLGLLIMALLLVLRFVPATKPTSDPS